MKLKDVVEEKVSENRLRGLFMECKIDGSLKSHANREEIKTDIDI